MLSNLVARYYKTKHRLKRIARPALLPKHFLVLDVGSGDSPFPVADVLCEKFAWDDAERTARMKRDRPFVVGDIEDLPFKDKVFDFVYCSHVLEHTLNPGKAITELERVAKGGYIEVPTALHEKTVKSYGGHLWFVSEENHQLVFRPKKAGVLDKDLNDFIEEHLYEKDAWFQAFYYARLYNYFHIGMTWQGRIPFRVEASHSQLGDFDKASVDMSHQNQKSERKDTLVSYLKKWMYERKSKSRHLNLNSIIACPICHGSLNNNASEYVCLTCRQKYPVVAESPVLLREAANPIADVPV